MLVTAVVKDNSLIISNIDLSDLEGEIDEYGMIQVEINFLGQSKGNETLKVTDND